jgi:Sec-independent protein translocase protein TatA
MFCPVIAFIAPGGGELLLILLVLILLFGAKDAPRILRNIQNVLNKMQRTAADFRYKLMYGDLHTQEPEESKDISAYDHPPETPPTVEKPEEHEKSA